MPDLTPAEELRTAAATIRQWAAEAAAVSPPPWTTHPISIGRTYLRDAESQKVLGSTGGRTVPSGDTYAYRGSSPASIHPAVGQWIALMGPGMGPLLAGWLEWMVRAERGASIAIPVAALAFARKINSKEPTQ